MDRGPAVVGSESPGDQAQMHNPEFANVPVLSFVIPALNEQRFIGRTIAAIHQAVGPYPSEIIVVDNGSSDSTASLASELGATVIQQAGGTIGSLRNTGARSARGDILIFLDADVLVTPGWSDRLPVALESLEQQSARLTGSLCSVPSDASWLERWWFAPRTGSSHLGTGHMLIRREFFVELGGFDETLATGEDYDLSRRAVEAGGRVVLDPELRVEHLGFPRTIRAFIQREAWHGVGDYRSMSSVVKSKVALATVVFVVLHTLALVGFLFGVQSLAAAALAAILILCVLSSYQKYRTQPFAVIVVNTALYWVYYFGRALAIIGRIFGTDSRGPR